MDQFLQGYAPSRFGAHNSNGLRYTCRIAVFVLIDIFGKKMKLHRKWPGEIHFVVTVSFFERLLRIVTVPGVAGDSFHSKFRLFICYHYY